MTIDAKTADEYISKIPEERKAAVSKLRETVKTNLPKGFEECINYGMIGYVVPHSLYPDGYHCDPKLPLPFASIASQKNFVALYTIRESMPIKTCTIGLWANTPNMRAPNWTWARAASVSRTSRTSPTSS